MGNMLKKLIYLIPIKGYNDYDLSIKTSEDFCSQFNHQIAYEGVLHLYRTFCSPELCLDFINSKMFSSMSKSRFKWLFKYELEVLNVFYNKPVHEVKRKIIMDRLSRHCFNVLCTYLSMIEVVYDPFALNNMLVQIAVHHSHITNPQRKFQIHDFYLRSFIEKEFMNCPTKWKNKLLHNYLRLIGSRLLVLVNQQATSGYLEHFKSLMELQKTDRRYSMEELFTNPEPALKLRSEYGLIDDEHPVYPGYISTMSITDDLSVYRITKL